MNSHWLTNIPNGWATLPLKRVAKLKNDRADGNSYNERYIGLENIEPWTGNLLPSPETTWLLDEENESKGVVGVFEPGDVLFGKLRPYLAKAHLAKKDGLCTTELIVLKPTQVAGRFLIRVLLTTRLYPFQVQ